MENYIQHLFCLYDDGIISDKELNEELKDCGYDDYILFREKIVDRQEFNRDKKFHTATYAIT